MEGYEVLEHTADVGLRASGRTLEETFEHATRGLAEILGAWSPRAGGRPEPVRVEAPDIGAVLVDWLNEILYLHDARDAVLTAIHVDAVSSGHAEGRVDLEPRGDTQLEGTAIKAVTWHQLRVEAVDDGWVAEVYVDV